MWIIKNDAGDKYLTIVKRGPYLGETGLRAGVFYSIVDEQFDDEMRDFPNLGAATTAARAWLANH